MKFTNRKNWVCFVLFLSVVTVLTMLLYFLYHNWIWVATDGLATGVLWILSLWTGLLAIRHYPARAGLGVYALVTGIMAGLTTWYGSSAFLTWWLEEEPLFKNIYGETLICRLIIQLTLSAWVLTLLAAYSRIRELKEQLQHQRDAATLHRDAELFNLRQQLQPHFLYNSLNSINALLLTDPPKAQEMTARVSDFLRMTVRRETQVNGTLPLEDELRYIETYLSIESIRFGDRLHIRYEKDYPEGMLIPPLILQPILENSIKFGLYGVTGRVEIIVQIRYRDPFLEIRMENPYDPLQQAPAGTGFGLKGISRRLFLLYARTDLLTTAIDGNRFITLVKIPQDHD